MMTIDQFKQLLPFSRVSFTYSSEQKLLVNPTDGSGVSSRVRFPAGVTKVSKYIVGVGTILHYTAMVRTAAEMQGATERGLVAAFIGQPLKGYEWVEGYEGALLRSTAKGTMQLRGYAIDDDVLRGTDTRYVDNATGDEISKKDFEMYLSTSKSALTANQRTPLVIDGKAICNADGTPCYKPHCKNFSLEKISDVVVNP